MYLRRRDEQGVSSGEQSPGWGAPQITTSVVGFGLAICLVALVYFRERLLRAARHRIVLWEEVYAKACNVNCEIMEDNDLFRRGLRYYMDREKQEEARGRSEPSRQDASESDTDAVDDDTRFSVGSKSDNDTTESADACQSPGRRVRPGEVKTVEIATKGPEQVEVSTEQSNTATPSELKVDFTNQPPRILSSSLALQRRRSLADELRDAGYDSQRSYSSSSSGGTDGSPVKAS